MPKRRRLTPAKKPKIIEREEVEVNDKATIPVTTPRGRLKGALLEALEPTDEEYESSYECSPSKRDRPSNNTKTYESEEEEEETRRETSPQRQSYVLKLFDRSVDLSQFREDSPLYPICRAWIANQPKANYKTFSRKKSPEPKPDSIELPGPEGPVLSRIPELIQEQKERNKDNINLNYGQLPSRETLLEGHLNRWSAVRSAWLEQANKVESRYASTQQILQTINVTAM